MVEGLGGSGKGRVTRVVCSTFPRRGKSATLESRMEMEELRRWREDCRVVTLLWRGDVIVPSFPSDLPVARLCLRVKRRQNILLRIVVRVCVGVGVEEGRGGERGRVLWGKRVVRRERRMGARWVGVRRLVWMVWERNLDWFRER